MKTAASEAEKPRNIQQKVDASHVRRRILETFSRSRYTANETQVRRSQDVSQYPAESRCRNEALTGAALDKDEISQNSTACVDGHRAAVQEKDTAHVKHLAPGAKRDTKLKYRTVVLKVLSRLPHRERISHSGVEDLS